jgi:hypothetical protein
VPPFRPHIDVEGADEVLFSGTDVPRAARVRDALRRTGPWLGRSLLRQQDPRTVPQPPPAQLPSHPHIAPPARRTDDGGCSFRCVVAWRFVSTTSRSDVREDTLDYGTLLPRRGRRARGAEPPDASVLARALIVRTPKTNLSLLPPPTDQHP